MSFFSIRKKNTIIYRFLKEFKEIIIFSTLFLIYTSFLELQILPSTFPFSSIDPMEILVSTIALIGSIIAYEGLTTWKKQIAGKYEYELAYKASIQLNQLRYSLHQIGRMWHVLNIDFTHYEGLPDHCIKKVICVQFDEKYEIILDEYENNLLKFSNLRFELDVLWGDKIGSLLPNLEISAHHLSARVSMFLPYMKERDITIRLFEKRDTVNWIFPYLYNENFLISDEEIKAKNYFIEFIEPFENNYKLLLTFFLEKLSV